MRFKSSLILLGLVLGLGSYAYLFEYSRPGDEDEKEAFSLRVETVRRMTIRQPSCSMAFERDGREWKMIEPMALRANAQALAEILVGLEHLPIERHLKGAKPSRTYGLDPPAATLTFVREAQTEGISLGNDSPDGKTAYAQRWGRGEVILVDREFAAKLRKGVNEYRDKVLVPLAKESVQRLTLAYPDRRLDVARTGLGWHLTEPLEAPAGGDETERAIATYLGARADTFVADGVKDFVPYGLDAPRLEVRMWIQGTTQPFGFSVGKRAPDPNPYERYPSFYARPAGTDTVVTVKIPRIDDYVKEFKHFQPRRLAAGAWDSLKRITIEGPAGTISAERVQPDRWESRTPHAGLLDPRRWEQRILQPLRTLEASSVETASPRSLSEAGLDHPLGRITLGWESAGDQTYTVGPVDPKLAEAYASAAGGKLLLTLPPSVADLLAQDYLELRDRGILSMPVSTVRSLELERPGGHPVFECEGRGAWAQTKPERLEGRLPGLEALVSSVAALRAERWAGYGNVDWAQAGLQPPAAVITFCEQDGNQPPRTHVVELGHADPTAGTVLARIDHEDVLAVLPARLLTLALSDPAKAPAP